MMASEERLSGSYGEMEEQNERIECATYNIPDPSVKGRVNMLLLQGPSVYDAWFSAASNQIAQVLLTLPTSFAQLGYASGVALQVVYGIMGSWACYVITWLYMGYRTRMEREGHTFKTHVIQWFEVLDGLLGRKWKYVGLAFNCVYLLFAAITQLIACGSNIFLLNNDLDKRDIRFRCLLFGDNLHSLVPKLPSVFVLRRCGDHVHVVAPGATHHGPKSLVLYFTGATNILYTFGSQAVTVQLECLLR